MIGDKKNKQIFWKVVGRNATLCAYLKGFIYFTSTFPKSKVSKALIKKVPFNTVLILFEIQTWGDTGNIYILTTLDYLRLLIKTCLITVNDVRPDSG